MGEEEAAVDTSQRNLPPEPGQWLPTPQDLGPTYLSASALTSSFLTAHTHLPELVLSPEGHSLPLCSHSFLCLGHSCHCPPT